MVERVLQHLECMCVAAYREIIPAIIRQIKDPARVIERKLPVGEPYKGSVHPTAVAAE
jgi:hypothetical protein